MMILNLPEAGNGACEASGKALCVLHCFQRILNFTKPEIPATGGEDLAEGRGDADEGERFDLAAAWKQKNIGIE